jgi:hypothetical protein
MIWSSDLISWILSHYIIIDFFMHERLDFESNLLIWDDSYCRFFINQLTSRRVVLWSFNRNDVLKSRWFLSYLLIFEDNRWVKHTRHNRVEDDRAQRALNEAVKFSWERRSEFSDVSIDELINKILEVKIFYIMRWISHLDLADRDSSNSFFSSVNKIRQNFSFLLIAFSIWWSSKFDNVFTFF